MRSRALRRSPGRGRRAGVGGGDGVATGLDLDRAVAAGGADELLIVHPVVSSIQRLPARLRTLWSGGPRWPLVVVDRAGLQVVLGHPERLLNLEQPVVGVDDELGGHRCAVGTCLEVGDIAFQPGESAGLRFECPVDAPGPAGQLDDRLRPYGCPRADVRKGGKAGERTRDGTAAAQVNSARTLPDRPIRLPVKVEVAGSNPVRTALLTLDDQREHVGATRGVAVTPSPGKRPSSLASSPSSLRSRSTTRSRRTRPAAAGLRASPLSRPAPAPRPRFYPRNGRMGGDVRRRVVGLPEVRLPAQRQATSPCPAGRPRRRCRARRMTTRCSPRPRPEFADPAAEQLGQNVGHMPRITGWNREVMDDAQPNLAERGHIPTGPANRDGTGHGRSGKLRSQRA
jgi:hypothetical protein